MVISAQELVIESQSRVCHRKDLNFSVVCIEVYLVTGGYNDYGNEEASTEILTEGSSSWTDVGPLPVPLWGLRGVSINNTIIMTGNRS